jgi:LacI family transcriptional regulator
VISLRVTIKDIAREANVSETTVSRVLNDKPDVSDETKAKIEKIMKEKGYKPNGIARGLVLDKTYTIGLIIPDISNPYFPEVAKGVENKAKDLGYSVIFSDTDNDKEEEKNAIELLKSKRVDGIILSLSIKNSNELKKLEKEDFPVVQIDRKVPGSKYPTIAIDNNDSAFKATKHLIDMGHTKIAHLTGDLDTKTGQDRLVGFKQALSQFDISYKEDWILEGDYSKESGFKLTNILLEQEERPTAIFAANDLMAIGAYEAIFNYGLKIPKDISIIGHDDIGIASTIRPGLTTMAQPKYKLGQEAAKILIKEIEDKKIEAGKSILLELSLVERESVRKR